MFKRILSLFLCMCMIFTACSKKTVSNEDLNAQSTAPADDKFELTALKSDKQGIDNSAGFQLTSKENINKKYVKNNLEIIPEEEFKIEELSSTVYNIIPLSRLENDKIYQLKLNDEEYVYSWAFQTKKKLEVESTLPADKSRDVPPNSGIEMYFTLGNLGKMDEFFEISPKVEGKFIRKSSSIIFVPEQLEQNTIYTVTIKKGFGLEDGTDKLEEDYVFTFGTQKENNSHIYFERPIINICEGNAKIVDACVGEEREYNINIYQYKNVNKFAEDVDSFAETGNFPKKPDENKLTLINSVKQKPFMKDMTYYSNALFELPNELAKGYYLLEFSSDDPQEKQYLFLQINDILIFNAMFEKQILIFAGDGNTGAGIKGAEVVLNGKTIGRTGEDGTLVCDKDLSELKKISMRVKAKGYNDFVYADSFFINNYYYRNLNDYSRYFSYIDTDRPVYQPTDTVNVWGIARLRDYSAVSRVRVELVEPRTDLVLETKNVNLTGMGTYETKFDLNNIASEYLKINVYDGDSLISDEYISIRKYTKPIYTLDGEPDKKFVFSGESLNYKINANFFDGYPVPNLELHFGTYKYSYHEDTEYTAMDNVIKLNEDGEATVSVNTDVKGSEWRPTGIRINCYNNEAEDTTVSIYDEVSIFTKHKMLEMYQDINDPQSINVLFHELDTAGYDQEKNYDYYGYEELRGKPLDDKINVKIIERYYEKIKKGEQYDFINKVNEVEYDYKKVENIIYDDYVSTISGIADIKIPGFSDEKIYKITAYYEDNNGGIEETIDVYGKRYGYSEDYYRLYRDDEKDSYRLNDNVNLQLNYGNEKVENSENDNLFIMYMRSGLIDYTVSGNTNLQVEFKEAFIPNVNVYAVYIKNGYIYPVIYYDGMNYDTSERKINLDIVTDKEEYRPGEEVTVKVKATDENNKPCAADVNISVVDEAYFAVFSKYVDTLENLYRHSWYDGLIKTYMSNIDLSQNRDGGAEKGGGGGDDSIFREKFEDTAVFKTITTGKDGSGTLKFRLADNLTSWRITCQGVTKNMYAGSAIKNITVSLPFCVDLIMGKEYLKEDEINVSLRAFGRNITESDTVDYKVIVRNEETDKKTEYSQSAGAGDFAKIKLNKLPKGQYEISVKAKCKGNEDGIREEFAVVDSSVYFNNTDYYKLSEKTVLDKVYSNPVITLFNESTSDFYNSLNKISSDYGNRIDQTVCSMIASKYINDYFDTDLHFNEEELLDEIGRYESEDGGIKLMPYSAPDAELTAKMVHIVDNDYLKEKMKVYLKNILSIEEYSTDVAAALWGMSKYREPVLLTIYDLLENQSLEARDKIYLSLALAELGDNKTARKYYREFADGLKEAGDYMYYGVWTDAQDNYELTALLSVLGVKLQEFDTSDRLFKYIYNKPSKYTLSSIEQLIYIMNRDIMKLDEIKDLFGEVTVDADGAKKTYKLKLFDRESFAVSKDKIRDVKFSNIKGSIACKVDALGDKDDLNKNKTDDFSIKTAYMLNETAAEQTVYNHSDVVKVTITPVFKSSVECGYYEITYVIPSGFRYINAGTDSSAVNINGQKLTFNYWYSKNNPDHKPLVFYMQAAQTGKYTVDYVVIKESMENRLNYLDKSTLTVN